MNQLVRKFESKIWIKLSEIRIKLSEQLNNIIRTIESNYLKNVIKLSEKFHKIIRKMADKLNQIIRKIE